MQVCGFSLLLVETALERSIVPKLKKKLESRQVFGRFYIVEEFTPDFKT